MIEQANILASNIDHVADWVELWIGSVVGMRTAAAALGAIFAVWLMQLMTPMAGLRGLVPVLRLGQRCGLAWLAIGLSLSAAEPLMPPHHKHYALIGLIVDLALLSLLFSSLILIYSQGGPHERRDI